MKQMMRMAVSMPKAVPGAALVLLHVLFILWNLNRLFGLVSPVGWTFSTAYAVLFLATFLLVRVQELERPIVWTFLLHIFLPLWFSLSVHTTLLSFNRPGEHHYHLYAGVFILAAMAASMWFAIGILRGEGGGWEALRRSPAGGVAAPGALATIILPAAVGAWGWSLVAAAIAAAFLTARPNLTNWMGAVVRGFTVRRVVIVVLCASALIRIAAVLALNRNIDESKPWGRSSWGFHHSAKMLAIDPAAVLRKRPSLEYRRNFGPAAKAGDLTQFVFEAKPGYAFFLGAFYRLTSPRVSSGRWFTLIVSLLTLYMTYYLATRLWNETVGLIALMLHASSAYLLWQGIYIDESTLAMLLFQISTVAAIKLLESRSWQRGLVFSLLAGLSFWSFTFVRPDNIHLFLPFWVLLIVKGGLKRWLPYVITALVFVTFWYGWTLRNQAVYGARGILYNSSDATAVKEHNPHLVRLGAFDGEGFDNLIWTVIRKPVAFTKAVLTYPATWERVRAFFDRRGLAFWDMSFLSLFDLSLYSFLFGLGIDAAAGVGIIIALRQNWWLALSILMAIVYRVSTIALLKWAPNYRILVEPLMLIFAGFGIYYLYQHTLGWARARGPMRT
jgi:hypothetical protein